MDGYPEGYPVKVIITGKDKSTQSDDTNNDIGSESRVLVSDTLPAPEGAMVSVPSTEPSGEEEEETKIREETSAALSREPDTRSVTFDNGQYSADGVGLEGERATSAGRDPGSPELCASGDALGIDKEIARRNAEATEDILNSADYSCETNASLTDFYTIELQRARTNTPTSTYCTDITECKTATKKSQPSDDSTNKSVIYQTAMTLMTERCSSTVGRNKRNCGSAANDKQAHGVQAPQFFYVEQNKPTPMTPLQAWRGYHGNVYFEPIKVQRARYSVPEQQEAPLEKCSEQLRGILKRSRRVQSSRSMPMVPVSDQEYSNIRPLARSMSNLVRNSARSNSRSPVHKGHRKMAVLDKKMVFSENNENIHEDIIWIVGQESTGSLLLDNRVAERKQPSSNGTLSNHARQQRQRNPIPQRQAAAGHQKKGAVDRERICRGSVVRKTHPARSTNMPVFSVTGARLAQQQLQSSPLLRTQTQYSHSNQRCVNSPDIFCGLDKLPPLEQLRASLRHIEPDQRANPTHVIGPLDRIKFEDTESITKNKPFVKYSADVTNTARFRNGQMSRQQKVM